VKRDHKKIERLMLFSEVAEKLSFTHAAESLSISKGHLSGQIRILEKELGMPLLVRSTRNVRLTNEGERIWAGMKKVRQDIVQIEKSAVNETREVEGLIKITAPTLFAKTFLLELMSKFKQLHPNIEFILDCSYTSHDLMKSEFDLAFRATSNPPQNMIARHLISYQHCCCASPEYLKAKGVPIIPADLLSHDCIVVNGQNIWQFLNEQVEVSSWLEVNDNHLIKSLALEGAGIIKVPTYLVQKELDNHSLIRFLDNKMPKGSEVFLLHPQLILQSRKLSAFISFVRNYFADL
jgi:DNA-binding transcriptional LysR family regulator